MGVRLKLRGAADECHSGSSDDGGGDRRREAKKWYEEARKLFEEAKYNEAAELCTRAISMDPGYASAYFNRALCHTILDNYEQAELNL